MDDFTVYGEYFQQDLDNLEKVLIRCQETNPLEMKNLEWFLQRVLC